MRRVIKYLEPKRRSERENEAAENVELAVVLFLAKKRAAT